MKNHYNDLNNCDNCDDRNDRNDLDNCDDRNDRDDRNYRNFDNASENIHELYKDIRTHQTVAHAKAMVHLYCTELNIWMDIWDAFEKLNNVIDKSDPDIDLPNLHHAFQTAEQARKSNEPDWFILTALIHDLGKMLYIKGCKEHGTTLDTQYSVVGDTHIVGCKMPEQLVMSQYNELCSDMQDTRYNTKYGMYNHGCGFNECVLSFGHDEYLYRILLYNNRHNPEFDLKLPEEAMYIIRYHSFYPWHSSGAYTHLANQKDKNRKQLLQRFSSYDLYTKCDVEVDYKQLKRYYQVLINKYFGTNKWLF